MMRRAHFNAQALAMTIAVMLVVSVTATAQTNLHTRQILSKDGVPIAVRCAGEGPTLLIVHGGVGDGTRWIPLFPLFADHFMVCAMDRRGHGASGDSPDYSLQKEVDDVVAVVNALPSPASVLGHSYGGVAAIEAALLTPRIARLILYEPPLLDHVDESLVGKLEHLIDTGQREDALVVFQREIVKVSDAEVTAMKSRPSWTALAATVDSQVRQIQALNRYTFNPNRMRGLTIPTLLLTGSRSSSPATKQALSSLMDLLPHRELKEFEGQEHSAMDAIPQTFADTVTAFLTRR